MRGDDDDATAVGDVAQELEHSLHLHVVEVRRRLVGEHKRRIVRERPGDGDPLLLAAGQVARPVVPAVFEANLFEEAVGALTCRRRAQARGAQRHLNVL